MLGVVNAEKSIVDPQNGGDKDSWRELEIDLKIVRGENSKEGTSTPLRWPRQ